MKISKTSLGCALGLLAAASLGFGCGSEPAAKKEAPSSKTPAASGTAVTGNAAGSKAEDKGDSGPKGQANAHAPTAARDKIDFLDVETSRDQPNTVEPCFRVLRTVYEKANNGKDFQVDFSIVYTSKGQQVTKLASVQVSDTTMDERLADKVKFVQVQAKIDVSSAPPDAGTKFDGSTLKLFRRNLEGESTVVASTEAPPSLAGPPPDSVPPPAP